ncbi:glycoside hydrolase family 88 protein [Paenibacillus sp. CAU 1782]
MLEIGFYVLLGLLVLVLLTFAVDLYPVLRDWTGRIHIGRYRDAETWAKSINERGARWLTRTPTIKLTDNSRLVLLDMLSGNYSRSQIQQWQEGALLLGFSEYLRHSKDEELDKKILRYFDAKFNSDGSWKEKPRHVDAGLLAYGVMKLAGDDADRFRPALDEIWALIADHVGMDGTVQYRKSMPDYRYVDTIGFVCPFLVIYGLRYGKDECVELALRQLRQYDREGMLGDRYIPGHAYHVGRGLPAGLYGWGRGLGWFAIGLIDAWNELPAHHNARIELEGMIAGFAQTLLKLQNPSGSWGWAVSRSESRQDSSTTVMLGWFLQLASGIKGLEKVCGEGASKAAAYLMSVTRRNGAVDFSQGDTKDIGVYSTLFTILPFTQGFSIRLAELARHKEGAGEDGGIKEAV